MHFKSLTFAALAAVAAAQLPTDNPAGQSVLSVLLTAIPPDTLSAAIADPSSFAAAISSSLSAGNTPSWYAALPSDVKSALPQLYPAATSAASTPSATAGSTSVAPSTGGSAGTVSATPTGGNSTTIAAVSSATLASTGGANSGKPSSAASTGGASYPTAVVGAGVAGALGFLGMLAL